MDSRRRGYSRRPCACHQDCQLLELDASARMWQSALLEFYFFWRCRKGRRCWERVVCPSNLKLYDPSNHAGLQVAPVSCRLGVDPRSPTDPSSYRVSLDLRKISHICSVSTQPLRRTAM
eukprot:179454-Hanusia_phi.AAC.1